MNKYEANLHCSIHPLLVGPGKRHMKAPSSIRLFVFALSANDGVYTGVYVCMCGCLVM